MPLSYTECKALKDAGFPQGYNPKYDTGLGGAPGSDVRNPSLSELIEACKEDFVDLGRFAHSKPGEDRWFAQAKETKTKLMRVTGSSPEQAVANLYLSLNKK